MKKKIYEWIRNNYSTRFIVCWLFSLGIMIGLMLSSVTGANPEITPPAANTTYHHIETRTFDDTVHIVRVLQKNDYTLKIIDIEVFSNSGLKKVYNVMEVKP